jgi:hypothetical protein
MTLVWRPGYGGAAVSDPDAQAYLQAVEVADNQALEQGVQQAVNQFVIGCKQDGIWNAIKASCILAGSRTLNGALVPLVGSAPTNNNFVSGDYNRKTGLKGDGTTKYLNSNRNNNADPQNNCHLAIYKNDSDVESNPYWIGSASSGFSVLNAIGRNGAYSNSNGYMNNANSSAGLHGISRSNGASAVLKRPSLSAVSFTLNSTTPPTVANFIYTVNENGTPSANNWSAARLAFYSIGESLDLAKLDTRVTALITAIGAAIP